jgi:hypothetical protein
LFDKPEELGSGVDQVRVAWLIGVPLEILQIDKVRSIRRRQILIGSRCEDSGVRRMGVSCATGTPGKHWRLSSNGRVPLAFHWNLYWQLHMQLHLHFHWQFQSQLHLQNLSA